MRNCASEVHASHAPERQQEISKCLKLPHTAADALLRLCAYIRINPKKIRGVSP